MLCLNLPVGLVPPTLKHESHPLQEPGLGPVWMVGIERKPTVVLKVWPEHGAVLELSVQDLTKGARGDTRL
eukprot:12148023-Alexandrium_andersonii.AAC.1